MTESISIIIVIMILIIMAFVFYGKVRQTDIQEKSNEYEELDLIELSQIVYQLPEIQCSFAEVADFGCVDILKFKYLGIMISGSQNSANDYTFNYYRKIFGTSKIWVQIISNDDNSTINMTLYENNRSLTHTSPIFMPVVVYNATNHQKSFGILNVEQIS